MARHKAILQAAIESLPFEFFAIGPDGRYILQNAILREHYGDAIGKRPEDYAPDEYTRQLWLDNNRRAFAGERVEGEIEAHIADETRHYYNVITPIRDDGEIFGILGVNVDITGRKRAEDEIQQANERLEQRVLRTDCRTEPRPTNGCKRKWHNGNRPRMPCGRTRPSTGHSSSPPRMPWSWLIYRGGSSSPRNELPNSMVPCIPRN